MRYPQVLVYESDGRLAELLRREAKPRTWTLREPRGSESCLRLLRRNGPSLLVIKLGNDLVRELTLLERATWLFPDTAAVVVANTEVPVVADLACDLGASCVLFPPLARHELLDVVCGLMESAVDRFSAVPAQQARATGQPSTDRSGNA